MIKSFRHKGLQRLYEKAPTPECKLNMSRSFVCSLQLAALETSQTIDDMDLPGYRLHRLKGYKPDRWAIDVSGNWRLTFTFESGDALEIDYEDYH